MITEVQSLEVSEMHCGLLEVLPGQTDYKISRSYDTFTLESDRCHQTQVVWACLSYAEITSVGKQTRLCVGTITLYLLHYSVLQQPHVLLKQTQSLRTSVNK